MIPSVPAGPGARVLMRSKALGFGLASIIAFALATCGGNRQICTSEARRAIDETIAAVGQPLGTSLDSRRDYGCAETSAGHSTDLTFADFRGTALELIDHYRQELNALGWHLEASSSQDNSVVFVKALARETRLVLVLSSGAGERTYSISLSEQPAE